MKPCDHIKELLVAKGRKAILQNEDLNAHLSGCPDCRRLLQAWEKIPGLLDHLPEHEPGEELVEDIKRAVLPAQHRSGAKRHRFLAPSLASAAVLLAAIGLSRELLIREYPKAPVPVLRPQTSGQTLYSADMEITELDRVEESGARLNSLWNVAVSSPAVPAKSREFEDRDKADDVKEKKLMSDEGVYAETEQFKKENRKRQSESRLAQSPVVLGGAGFGYDLNEQVSLNEPLISLRITSKPQTSSPSLPRVIGLIPTFPVILKFACSAPAWRSGIAVG